MAEQNPPILDQVVREFGEARKYHDTFRRKVERNYKAYRGVLEKRSDAAKWTSKQHPPYVFQLVETITANMIDDRLSFAVRPRPHIESVEEVQTRQDAARSLEYVLRYEMDIDNFQESHRPFALQGSIAGISVRKNYWRFSQMPVQRRTVEQVPVLHPETNEPIGTVPQLRAAERVEVVHDNPTSEVVDVRDFIWHEAATSLEKAKWVIHRIWMTIDEIREMVARGVYDAKAVDRLGESRDFMDDVSNREEELFQSRRTKDMIEVLEYWTNDRVVTVANRAVLLSDRPNPFWHKQKPFVVASSMPDMFRIAGISDVEIVADLQDMLWTVMNQRLDNLLLINNAIILLRSDIDDTDAFEFAPGAQWVVDDPQQVVMWTPNALPAEVSVAAENLIKGDMQNITGGVPLLSGSDDQIDNKTATGISIFTNLAQRRLAAKKQNYLYAYRRVAQQWIQLIQQFMSAPKVIQIVGQGGRPDFITVRPEEIQGKFNVEVEALAESLMRQERRAEGQALVQLAAQIAPVMQAVGQPINMRAFVEDWLRDYDVMDPDRYFAEAPQPQLLQQGAPSGQSDGGPPQGGPPTNGVTAPQSIAPEVSPSNQASLAPAQFLQRALAARGGQMNAGQNYRL